MWYRQVSTVVKRLNKSTSDCGYIDSCPEYIITVFAILFTTAKPEAVSRCEVELNSGWGTNTPVLSCTPGWNGGLNQTFILEVLKSKNVYSRPLALVKHSISPTFSLETLDAGEEYLLIVTAANAKGASSPFTLSYRAPPFPNSPPTSSSPDAFASKQHLSLPWGVFAGMMLGVFATVLICFIVAIFIARRRTAAREARNIPVPSTSGAKSAPNNTSTIQRNTNRRKTNSDTLKLKPSPILARKGKAMCNVQIGKWFDFNWLTVNHGLEISYFMKFQARWLLETIWRRTPHPAEVMEPSVEVWSKSSQYRVPPPTQL